MLRARRVLHGRVKMRAARLVRFSGTKVALKCLFGSTESLIAKQIVARP